jgi:hypothetical protein
MFDLRAALERFCGQEYEFGQLEELLRRIRLEHLGEISPEIGVDELLRLAKRKNWIREDDAGNFHIEVGKAA